MAVESGSKLGLLVAVAFLVLFMMILIGRAQSTVAEHAVLPTGKSVVHTDRAERVRQTGEAGGGDAFPSLPGQPAVPPAAEILPVADPAPAEPAPAAPETREGVAVAFVRDALPAVVIETPFDRAMPDSRTSGGEGDGDPAGSDPAGGDAQPVPDPAKPAPAAPAPEPSRPTHIVRAGETLTSLARLYYGREGEHLWRKIHEANKDLLRDPHRLTAGQALVIPGLPAETAKAPGGTGAPGAGAAGGEAARLGIRSPAGTRSAAESLKAALQGVAAEEKAGSGGPGREAAERPLALPLEDLAKVIGRRSDLAEHPAGPPAMYVVQPGETFYRLGERLYGNGGKYGPLLHTQNKHLVPDPARLRAGQQILLLEGMTPLADGAVALR